MARAARSSDLRAAFEKHKLEAGASARSKCSRSSARAQSKTRSAINGILDEGEEITETFKGRLALESRATSPGRKDVADLPGRTLAEETAADKALKTPAEGSVNTAALESA